jgi:hypothetical protein
MYEVNIRQVGIENVLSKTGAQSPRQRNWCRLAARREILESVLFVTEKTTDFDCHRVERTSLRAGESSAFPRRTLTPT